MTGIKLFLCFEIFHFHNILPCVDFSYGYFVSKLTMFYYYCFSSTVQLLTHLPAYLLACRIGLTSRAAGALTQSTFEAAKSTVLTACKKDHVKTFTEKINAGHRTVITTTDEKKFSISKSAGKHTNAILTCMEWMRQNVPTLTIDRQLYLDNANKELFFSALKKTAESAPDDQGHRQLEKVRIGDMAAATFCRWQASNSAATIAIADLILIGLNHSEHYVSAIAINFRKAVSHDKTKVNSSPQSSTKK
jgi:hypothetical protein